MCPWSSYLPRKRVATGIFVTDTVRVMICHMRQGDDYTRIYSIYDNPATILQDGPLSPVITCRQQLAVATTTAMTGQGTSNWTSDIIQRSEKVTVRVITILCCQMWTAAWTDQLQMLIPGFALMVVFHGPQRHSDCWGRATGVIGFRYWIQLIICKTFQKQRWKCNDMMCSGGEIIGDNIDPWTHPL